MTEPTDEQAGDFLYNAQPIYNRVRAIIAADRAQRVPEPEQHHFPHEDMDKVALDRYKVAKSISTIWPYSVAAGDGNQELFHGGESTCKHVARKLAGAFLDGAFYAYAQRQKELEASTCYMTNDATREECIRQAIEADRAQQADEIAALRAHLAQPERNPSKAEADVLAERQRQIKVEGWTVEHDDEHEGGHLAAAAAAYAAMAGGFGYLKSRELFPWGDNYWKPKGARSNLVKAGALILAEIERLDRATPQAQPERKPMTDVELNAGICPHCGRAP